MYSYLLCRILNTRLAGTSAINPRVHIYFNYLQFNTDSVKTHTLELLKRQQVLSLIIFPKIF